MFDLYIVSLTGEATSPEGLSSGAITGIIFAIIFFVFFLTPMGYYFGKDYWRKRHQYGWYNRLTTPSEWCDCFPSPPSARRTFNLRSNTAEVTIEPEVTLQDIEPTTVSDKSVSIIGSLDSLPHLLNLHMFILYLCDLSVPIE